MSSTAWSHLPNAVLIDWALQSLKNRPELWDAAWDTTRSAARLKGAAFAAAWNTAWNTGRLGTWNAAQNVTWTETRLVLGALVAYDDCNEYLQMTYEHLRAWAILSETPQAILLLPLKWVQENECLVTTA